MKQPSETVASALTRRHFALWMTASGLTACGGGGSGEAPAPAPAPSAPGPSSVSLLAGGLGGSGFLAGTGTQARLPWKLIGPAFTSQGHLWFTGEHLDVQRIGKVSPDGALTYRTPETELPAFVTGGVVDVQDRYLVAIPVAGLGPVRVICTVQGDSLEILAGLATDPTQPDVMQDGKGRSARICQFDSPVLAGDGMVYFLDRTFLGPHEMLRTLAPDGTVTSLLPAPVGSRLVLSPTGAVRKFIDVAGHVEWAELANTAPGGYAWNVLPSNWPSGSAVPLAPVKGSADRYWGYDAAARTVAHYALDGTRQNARQLPGAPEAAAANPATGQIALSIRRDLPGAPLFPAELYLLDPSPAPTAPLSAWVGLPDQLGHADGVGDAARFDFTGGAHAVSEGSGPLFVAVGAGTTYGGAAPPVRTVAPSGQVASTALPYRRTGLLAIAYGYLLTYDRSTNTVLRTPKNGSGTVWEPWVQSSVFAGYGGLQVLRPDTTGLLWFATRTLPAGGGGGSNPTGEGTSLIGTISATGQVQVLLGDPQQVYSAANYPPLAQRPWYLDITDIAFEGTASPVSWVLCNRTVLTSQGEFERYAPELVRLEGATRQAFALPGLDTQRRELMPYQQLCVLPSRPGQVFLSGPCGVYRWTVAKDLELVAGQADPTPGGVRLGSLPASLNLVKFISPGPDANSLYVGSENSVLRLGLPG